MGALYLVLDQMLTVLCEVPKHYNLVHIERFLLRFDISCLDFRQVRLLSKVVDPVNEEFLVFFKYVVVSVAIAARSVVCH